MLSEERLRGRVTAWSPGASSTVTLGLPGCIDEELTHFSGWGVQRTPGGMPQNDDSSTLLFPSAHPYSGARMSTPQNRPGKLTIKEERAQKRVAQLEAFKKREAAGRRNRILGIIGGVLALVLVIGGVTAALYYGTQEQTANVPPIEEPIAEQTTPQDELEGSYEDRLRLYPEVAATHTTEEVDYDPIPPVGGNHDGTWLNCGVYTEQQRNENAVHALEHGAVWITYDPAYIDPNEVDALIALAPDSYVVISPYPGIGEAMAVSAWGAQLRFIDVADPAVLEFIEQFWQSADGPEPGAPCTGGIDGPGKVS
jgi:hypothetical protein